MSEILGRENLGALAGKRAFFFDRDGTLSLGDEPIDGARRFLDHLRSNGVRCFLMTSILDRCVESVQA